MFGASAQSQAESNRFYHNKLDFTFRYPEGWSVTQGSRDVTVTSKDGSASMAITLSRLDAGVTPIEFLTSTASGDLKDSRELEQFGLQGGTAIATAGSNEKRLAVLDHKYRFLFEGTGSDADALVIIESFRPLVAKEKAKGPSRTLHYVQVPSKRKRYL